MSPEEYIKATARTDGDNAHYAQAASRAMACVKMTHYTDGLCTEAAELKDVFKKHIAYGTAIDMPNVKEEAGDLLWYLARICDLAGWTIEELMELNINKLKARFPEKFTQDKAENRDLSKEREILEKGLSTPTACEICGDWIMVSDKPKASKAQCCTRLRCEIKIKEQIKNKGKK